MVTLQRDSVLQEQSREFLRLLTRATRDGNMDVQQSPWQEVRELLTSISRLRGQQGFSPSATATFIFSFKDLCLRTSAESGRVIRSR